MHVFFSFITRQICRFCNRAIQSCLMTFAISWHFRIFLVNISKRKKKSSKNSKKEQFVWNFESDLERVKTHQLLCQPPYQGNCKISWNSAVFFFLFRISETFFFVLTLITLINAPLRFFFCRTHKKHHLLWPKSRCKTSMFSLFRTALAFF